MNRRSKEEGFSLVELIVVIAIMAILVGVLAPAYLRYVEKARKSSDTQAIAEIMGAANNTATDEEYHIPAGTVFKISGVSGEIVLTIPSDTWDEDAQPDSYRVFAEDDWNEGSNQGKPYYLKAKEYKARDGELSGTIDETGGLNWKNTDGDLFIKMGNFSKDLASKFEI